MNFTKMPWFSKPNDTVYLDPNNSSQSTYSRTHASWLQTLAMTTLKTGPTPKHIAFIMDGNRRYSKEHGFANVTEGYRLGDKSMHLMLDRCFDLGANNVTVYAFSLENFKRSKQELQGLFGLLNERLDDYKSETQEERDKRFFGVRIIGDISRFPSHLRRKLANFSLNEGSHYTRWLNICLGYTSRAEISDAIQSIRWGIRKGLIRPEDVNQSLLESCFWLPSSLPPVDLLVRTSGEIRLSDFLTWQTMFTPLVFVETLWPEITCWTLLKIILTYQRHFEKYQEQHQEYLERREREEEEYQENLGKILNQLPTSCREERKARVDSFLQNLAEKKLEELKNYVTQD